MITASFQKVSGKKKTFQEITANDQRHSIQRKWVVVPRNTLRLAITHSPHVGETTQTKKVPEFLTGSNTTTWPAIILASAPVIDILAPRQLTNSWTNTKTAELKFKKYLWPSSFSHSRNCIPTMAVSIYIVEASIHKHPDSSWKILKIWIFRAPIPHNAWNALRNDGGVENLPPPYLQKETLQTFENIGAPNRKTLENRIWTNLRQTIIASHSYK